MKINNAARLATSHAGKHGDFEVVWCNIPSDYPGWYWRGYGCANGPFKTSQAAFGDVKDLIDSEIRDAS